MASSYIHRTNSSGSGTTATVSMWVKQNQVTADGGLFQFYTDASNYVSFYCNPDVKFRTYISNSYSQGDKATKHKNRDPAAWYHYVCVFDTTNGDANDRMRLWINGVRIDDPELNTDVDPSASYSFTPLVSGIFQLNKYGGNSTYSDHVYSHVHYCDGYAYDASTFGEFDSTSGIWKIKTGPSVSYGTNGVFLKFEDRTNLDLDSSPNAHTMTTVGTITPTYDNPSNNFCTWNPLGTRTDNVPTFTNGNTTTINTASAWGSIGGTLLAKSGKWYYEAVGGNSTGYMHYGFASSDYFARGGANYGYMGEPGTGISFPSYSYYGSNGNIYYNTTTSNSQATAYGATYGTTDYIGVFLDLDNSKMYWSKNGVIQNSGTGQTIDNANSDFWTPITGNYNDASGHDTNFGNGVFGTTALTGTTYSDANSKGTFKYSPNDSGGSSFDGSAKDFYALITSNIKLYG